MKNTLRVTLLVLIVVLCVFSAIAGNSNRVGTAGAQELLLPVGAKGIALAGSQVACATGVEAIFWNPAGVARAQRDVEGIFSSMTYIADIGVNYAAISVKAGDIGTFGLSLKSISTGDIQVTTELFPDGTGEYYSPGLLDVGLTYSKLIVDRISIGATAMIISNSYMSTSATGVGFNLGIQYSSFGMKGLGLGIAVKNVGTTMKLTGPNLLRKATVTDANRPEQYYSVDAAPYELPTSIELGLSYQKDIGEKHGITLSGDFQNNNFSADEVRLGAEYVYASQFYLRLGYAFSAQDVKDDLDQSAYIYGFTFGLGAKFNLSDMLFGFDYAYRSVDYFDGNNVITLTVGF